jgi:hypothetical protein
MGNKMNDTISKKSDPAFIKIYVPIAHDEETELDVWDVDFAYNEFANAIKEFENDNDMRYDAWNSKQRDYMNDQR